MKKLLLLSCLLGLVSPVFAADWVLVARASDLSVYYVDKDSVTYNRARGIVTVWTLKEGYEEEYKGQTEVRNKTRGEYHCKTRQHKPLSGIYYNSMGGVIDSVTLSNPPLNHIAPDTVGEDVLNSVCTNPPQVISLHEAPVDSAKAAEEAAKTAYESNTRKVWQAFITRPENQVFQEGTLEYETLDAQVRILQTTQPNLDLATMLQKARQATAAIVDIPPVPQSKPTPRPAVKPAPQRQQQKQPDTKSISNRNYF